MSGTANKKRFYFVTVQQKKPKSPGYQKRRYNFLRRKFKIEQDNKCYWCGELMLRVDHNLPMVSIDHVVPKWLGGTNAVHNLVGSCQRCNREKGGIAPWLGIYYEPHQHPKNIQRQKETQTAKREKYMRKLGSTQEEVLIALAIHGRWYRHCWWNYGNTNTQTERFMERFWKLGMVTKIKRTTAPFVYEYCPTPDAVKLADDIIEVRRSDFLAKKAVSVG